MRSHRPTSFASSLVAIALPCSIECADAGGASGSGTGGSSSGTSSPGSTSSTTSAGSGGSGGGDDPRRLAVAVGDQLAAGDLLVQLKLAD